MKNERTPISKPTDWVTGVGWGARNKNHRGMWHELSIVLWSLCGVNVGSWEKRMLARLKEIVVSTKKTQFIYVEMF